jgi:hypothetical protein
LSVNEMQRRIVLAVLVLLALVPGCSASAESSPEPAATVLGSASANPPAAPLAGLTLEGQLFAPTGVSRFAVSFGARDASSAAVVATLNAALEPVITASDERGFVRLTANGAGEDTFLYVFEGGAGSVLGFSAVP